MSLWGKLFGSKPKTIDDELVDAAKALGWDKSITQQAIKEGLEMGFSKEELLESFRDKHREGKK